MTNKDPDKMSERELRLGYKDALAEIERVKRNQREWVEKNAEHLKRILSGVLE